MIFGEIKRNNRGVEYVETEGNIIAKTCTKCLCLKVLGEFPKERTGFCGKRSICSVCNAERRRFHYSSNRDAELKRSADYRIKNLEKVQEKRRVRYLENKEQECAKAVKWKSENKERVAKNRQNREARKRNLPNTLTSREITEIHKTFKGKCAMTGKEGELHLDHFIPLCAGAGGTTKANIVPILSELNVSKGGKNPFEWFSENKRRFGIEDSNFRELVEYLACENGMTYLEYEKYVNHCFEGETPIIQEGA